MTVSLIAAVAENRVIGSGNGLPWRLSADLRRFKALTIGHVVIVGRRTFESIGRPLPGRRLIVVSRTPGGSVAGVETVPSLDHALRRAGGEDEVFVAGGGEIFREALPLADRMYLTMVHAVVEGDVVFPEFAPDDWRLVEDEPHPADQRNQYPYSFRRYDRVSGKR